MLARGYWRSIALSFSTKSKRGTNSLSESGMKRTRAGVQSADATAPRAHLLPLAGAHPVHPERVAAGVVPPAEGLAQRAGDVDGHVAGRHARAPRDRRARPAAEQPQVAADLGLYPTVTSQCSSPTLDQVCGRIHEPCF